MCDYCTCRDVNPTTGMRVGRWAGDSDDYQGKQSYSWTNNPVYSNPGNMNPVPEPGEQFRQQAVPQAPPIVLGTD